MSISEWKEREKEQRRKDIVDVAEKLFFASSYDTVSMDEIAREAGLKKATLYLYFKNKEALFFAVVLRGFKLLNAMVRENQQKGKTGYDRLLQISHAYFSFVDQYPEYNRVCAYFYSGRFNLASLSAGEDITSQSFYGSSYQYWKAIEIASTMVGEDAKEIVELNREIFSLVCDAISDGISEGVFRKDADPVEAAVIFTLLLESTPGMRLDLRQALESRGTDQQKFARIVEDYLGHMLTRGK